MLRCGGEGGVFKSGGGGEILFVWKGRYLCIVVTCMVEGLVGAFHTAPND